MKKMATKTFFNNKTIATIYLVMMCVQLVAIEGPGISSLKIGLMAFAPIIFVFRQSYLNRVFLLGMAYWLFCFLSTYYNEDTRFSTIGYMGMFIITFIVFYNLIYSGAFSLQYFVKLLRWFILVYCMVLIMQQLSMLIGLHSLWFINLDNQPFLSLTKLPSLSLEPSHTARLLTAMMLGYIRSFEIIHNKHITFRSLFTKENRIIIILFLWSMLTMGSGTAFIGLGILSLYFIRWDTAIFVVPFLLILFFVGKSMGLEQLDRAVSVTKATMTGKTEVIDSADGSAASRIIPIINTFTKTDISDMQSWLGKGTFSEEHKEIWWTQMDRKLDIVEQYGLLVYILLLVYVYTVMIRSFFSIESIIFIVLLGFSLNSFYYIWGTMMIFTTVRYFQLQNKIGAIGNNRKT